jgi:hypothetical protein
VTDRETHSETPPAVQPKDVPPLWPVFANLGATICAGMAAYESFHMRPAFGWGAGIFICLIVGWLGKR